MITDEFTTRSDCTTPAWAGTAEAPGADEGDHEHEMTDAERDPDGRPDPKGLQGAASDHEIEMLEAAVAAATAAAATVADAGEGAGAAAGVRPAAGGPLGVGAGGGCDMGLPGMPGGCQAAPQAGVLMAGPGPPQLGDIAAVVAAAAAAAVVGAAQRGRGGACGGEGMRKRRHGAWEAAERSHSSGSNPSPGGVWDYAGEPASGESQKNARSQVQPALQSQQLPPQHQQLPPQHQQLPPQQQQQRDAGKRSAPDTAAPSTHALPALQQQRQAAGAEGGPSPLRAPAPAAGSQIAPEAAPSLRENQQQ